MTCIAAMVLLLLVLIFGGSVAAGALNGTDTHRNANNGRRR